MVTAERTPDVLQLEALLLARTYLYTLFHKLFGGTPDATLLAELLSRQAADVVEEFSGENAKLRNLLGFLAGLRAQDADALLDAARNEYTRVFVGPDALPASPYESPYTGAHDMALFQENTLAVRRAYHDRGLRVRREQAVPDDHVSALCALLTELSARSLEALRTGDFAILAARLRDQLEFTSAHMGEWLAVFAKSVRNSKAGSDAVLYPQMLEALAAFARADADFLAESSFWASSQQAGDYLTPAPELAAAESALDRLRGLRPFGIEDYELVPID